MTVSNRVDKVGDVRVSILRHRFDVDFPEPILPAIAIVFFIAVVPYRNPAIIEP